VVRVRIPIVAGEREEQQPAADREGDQVQYRDEDDKLGVSAH
jgi:hypothetical protein